MAGSAFVVITGILSDDPVSRAVRSGATVVSFRMGWSRKVNQETKWANIDVTCFGKNGEKAAEWLKKGSGVTISGELQQEEWDDKETGKKRYKHSVVCDRLVFGPSKKEDSDEKPAQQKKTETKKAKKEEFPDASDEFGDVPF